MTQAFFILAESIGTHMTKYYNNRHNKQSRLYSYNGIYMSKCQLTDTGSNTNTEII